MMKQEEKKKEPLQICFENSELGNEARIRESCSTITTRRSNPESSFGGANMSPALSKRIQAYREEGGVAQIMGP